jgi:ABC-2 type transport system ATP-binding protein
MPELRQPADPRGGDRPLTEPDAATRRRGDTETPATANGLQTVYGSTRQRIPAPALTTPCLLFDQVSKWYGPVIGVNQITLELRQGITGLVGANGAGKTTLLRLAGGHLRPEIGAVRVCGLDAWTARAKGLIGYCPETDTFYEEMSGRHFVEAMARLNGFTRAEARRRTSATLELVGMAGRAEQCLRGYSKGMRQRIKLAQALIHDPPLLLLDEPLNGIDPLGRQDSLRLFRELADRGKCLLVSSHELEELEKLTEHVAIMAHGRLAAVGTLTQIRDLLDDHPLSIRIVADKSRSLAGALLGLPDVVGVDLGDPGDQGDDDSLIVRARNPRRFFRDLGGLVLEEHWEIRHLETLDDSTHAILGYLLGGRLAGVTRRQE